ncbi:MAG: hypothetical protein AB1609_03180 [Bacillota bacterium]
MSDSVLAYGVLAAICLGLLVSAAAASPALGRPFVAPLVDLDALVVGAEAGVETLPYDARVAAGVGWGFETARLHWRLRAGLPLGLSATARLGYQDWPEGYLLGQAREQGFEGAFSWEPNWRTQVAGRLFYGRVGQTAELLDRQVSYGWLQHDGRLVYSWPLEVRARTEVVYGRAAPYPPAAGQDGSFYALSVTLPVRLEHLHVIPRLGYSAGEQVLPGFRYRLGGYGDGWLRAYGPGAFSGPILLNGTVEYRRPWLEALPVPVLSQLEGGPFLDAGTTASHGTAWVQLEWQHSYGLTAALPLSGILLGMDLAWNEQGHFRAGLRASDEF